MLVILICRDEFVTAVVWKSDLTIFIFLAEEERSLYQENQLPTSSLVLMRLKQGVISKMDIEMVTAVIKENKGGFFVFCFADSGSSPPPSPGGLNSGCLANHIRSLSLKAVDMFILSLSYSQISKVFESQTLNQ